MQPAGSSEIFGSWVHGVTFRKTFIFVVLLLLRRRLLLFFFFFFNDATVRFPPNLFRKFTSRYPYPLLVFSMFLYSATTRIPSWCHSISVMVFPQVFFHGILHLSTFSTLSEAFLEPSWKFLSYRVGTLVPRPTLLFLDFWLSRNQQLRTRRIFLSQCPKEIRIPKFRHILGRKLDLLRCYRVCLLSGGEVGTLLPNKQERSYFRCESKSQKCRHLSVVYGRLP